MHPVCLDCVYDSSYANMTHIYACTMPVQAHTYIPTRTHIRTHKNAYTQTKTHMPTHICIGLFESSLAYAQWRTHTKQPYTHVQHACTHAQMMVTCVTHLQPPSRHMTCAQMSVCPCYASVSWLYVGGHMSSACLHSYACMCRS